MSDAVGLFNQAVGVVFDLLLAPFAGLAPVWGLLFVSVLSGVVLVLLYGKVSNQAGLRKVKNRIFSYLLEAVIYRHDLKLCLGAQAKMFAQAFVYVAYAIPPILVLMIPCLIILAQLNLRYDVRGFSSGEHGLLEVRFSDPDVLEDVQLKTSPGLAATPALRDPEQGKAYWRLDAKGSGAQQISLNFSSSAPEFTQAVVFNQSGTAIWAKNYKNWLLSLIYPASSGFSKSGTLAELKLSYPEMRYRIFGINMHWLVVFAIVSILSGLAGSKIFGVEV